MKRLYQKSILSIFLLLFAVKSKAMEDKTMEDSDSFSWSKNSSFKETQDNFMSDNIFGISQILLEKAKSSSKLPSRFYTIVKNDDGERCEEYLKTAEDLNQLEFVLTARNMFDATFLHVAAIRGCKRVIRIMLEYAKKIEIHEKLLTSFNLRRDTPLHTAAYWNAREAAIGILDFAEQENILSLVLKAKAKDNRTALHQAFLSRDVKIASIILRYAQRGGLFDIVLNARTNNGKRPLEMGAYSELIRKRVATYK